MHQFASEIAIQEPMHGQAIAMEISIMRISTSILDGMDLSAALAITHFKQYYMKSAMFLA